MWCARAGGAMSRRRETPRPMGYVAMDAHDSAGSAELWHDIAANVDNADELRRVLMAAFEQISEQGRLIAELSERLLAVTDAAEVFMAAKTKP